ncbi:unnamed protein product [Closterium sp. NIES-65]|nr:unnamed protein product [Closterium sp. NIES-65]
MIELPQMQVQSPCLRTACRVTALHMLAAPSHLEPGRKQRRPSHLSPPASFRRLLPQVPSLHFLRYWTWMACPNSCILFVNSATVPSMVVLCSSRTLTVP